MAKQFFDKLDQDIQQLVSAYPQLDTWGWSASEADPWTDEPFPDGTRFSREGRSLTYHRHIRRTPGMRYGQEACELNVHLYVQAEFHLLEGQGSATIFGKRLGPYYVVAGITTANPAVPELEQKVTALILRNIRELAKTTDFPETSTDYPTMTPLRLEDVGLTPKRVEAVLGAEPFVWSTQQVRLLKLDAEQLYRLRRRHYAAYHAQQVCIEGMYENAFEHLAIQGIWMQFLPGTLQPLEDSAAAQRAREQANKNPMRLFELPVRVCGTLDAERGGYGHLGGYPAELTVERLEVLGE